MEMTTWVILGSKVLKLIFAAGILILVRFFTEEPIFSFGIKLIIILLISIIIESAYFLYNGKRKINNEKQ